MTLKKSIALLTALLLLCLGCTALAETLTIGTTDYTLEIGEMEADELTLEDLADDMVGYYYGDEFDLALWQFDAEGATLDELLAYYEDDEAVTECGTTEINGIEAIYLTGSDTEASGYAYLYVDYLLLFDGDIVQISFYMDDAAASQAAADVMNTLSR